MFTYWIGVLMVAARSLMRRCKLTKIRKFVVDLRKDGDATLYFFPQHTQRIATLYRCFKSWVVAIKRNSNIFL